VTDRESRYHNVDIAERLGHLMLGPIAECDEILYSWSHGYERLRVKHSGGGGLEYEGMFHPNVVCEGGAVCVWCGRTLEFT
jgi:hypothetical protein